MKYFVISLLVTISLGTKAQKIERIYFNLYTDSLKKGVHNYINVEAEMSNGRYLPLNDKQINFWCNTGEWEGNDLIIDSAYKADSVVVKATLKDPSNFSKTITIYLKKKLDGPLLKTEAEIMNDKRKGGL